MNTTNIGNDAEELVADYLRDMGHKIVERNWKTRWCEIDIVSKHKKTIYFTEVKFRSNSYWGDGLDMITNKKLKQMKFSAEFWIAENNWKGEAQLLGASVDRTNSINLVEINT